MAAPATIRDLIKRFPEKGSPSFYALKETAVRREFIDPFFEALGWDVANRSGDLADYKEVIHEDTVDVGGGRLKAPDYAFRIGGVRKFFVEAKKPSVNLQEDPQPAYQLRRYAWSANLPLSILSDFQEFSVYDCMAEPVVGERADASRPIYVPYTSYEDEWDLISSLFSKEAVLGGSLETFGSSRAGRRGSKRVDAAFLRDLNRWRYVLAQHLADFNPELSSAELNVSVQLLLDRITFLRICEERGIEPYERLKLVAQTEDPYRNLCSFFLDADDRYNSGLFHFHKERGRVELADDLALTLNVASEPLREVIHGLYYPHPYEFRMIPRDILGQVYEQFIGSIILVGEDRQVTVEDKPEIRKAGGVFYTPPDIVDYIVDSTVGRLLEGKTPEEVSSLKIVDMASGSGSFLVGAYQCLLEWHRAYYLADGPDQHREELYQSVGGEWELNPAERKRILLNNIYGVDIDPLAIDKTKLSLLLMVLEGATQQTLALQLRFAHERALPDLGSNIKCGNSLVGYDDYIFSQSSFLDAESLHNIRRFDWHKAFPQVFERDNPGFDVAISNPPYVRQELLGHLKDYFQRHYQVFHGTADLYTYFIERAMSLLRSGGQFGIIVANKWMRANYGKPLRRWLKQQRIEEVTDFGDLPVFGSVTTYPCILRLSKNPPRLSFAAARVKTLQARDLAEHVRSETYFVSQLALDDDGWSLAEHRHQALKERLQASGMPLAEYLTYGEKKRGKTFRGILTGLNEAFVLDAATRDRLVAEDPRSGEVIAPFLMGRDIKRYHIPQSSRYVILMPRGWTNARSGGVLDAWEWLSSTYPAIARHLAPYQSAAEQRWDKGDHWWELRACDYYGEFEKPKIIYASVAQGGTFALDRAGTFVDKTCYFIPSNDPYLLGLLNSRLMLYYFSQIAVQRRGGYFEYLGQYVESLPIRVVNPAHPGQMGKHDGIADLANNMQKLHSLRANARTPHDKERIDSEIAETDHSLDCHVYELYGLTDEDIALVEPATKP